MHLATVALSARVRLDPSVFDRYVAASPTLVGEELADAVQAYVREHKLGYYPALEYFRDQGGIDSALLEAADGIAWVASSLVREEVRVRLRPIFASVRFGALQALAFTLPPVRPSSAEPRAALARHYTPDTVKLDLLVTLLQRETPPDGLDTLASHMLVRWLKPSFAALEVTAARQV